MELKANELRSGNLVYLTKDNFKNVKEYQLNSFDIYKLDESDCEDVKPIPLTEEWLFKFGFELKYGCFLLSTNRGTILIEEDLAQISSVISHDGFMAHCQFVHQLQNLYFALTNKELEIKM